MTFSKPAWLERLEAIVTVRQEGVPILPVSVALTAERRDWLTADRSGSGYRSCREPMR